MAELKKEHEMLLIMGDTAAANICQAELDHLTEQWEHMSARHAPQYMRQLQPADFYTSGLGTQEAKVYPELKPGNTQGM